MRRLRMTRAARSAGLNAKGKRYLEFRLDAPTWHEVGALARKSHCAPFEMCVKLLRESCSVRERAGLAGCADLQET